MEDLIKELKGLRFIIEEVADNIKGRSSSYKDLEDLQAIEQSNFLEPHICNKIKELLKLEQEMKVNISYPEKKIEAILNDIQDVQLYININYYQWLQFF